MKVIIIEDEAPAARRLTDLLNKQEKPFEILAVLDSIADSVEWLRTNDSPDLIFMDIMLADGQSFDIFEQTTVVSPVIFTTAYDEFALKAFQVNSIDYLLKPIDPRLLTKAIDKLAALQAGNSDIGKLLAGYLQANSPVTTHQEQYKERFLIKIGEKMIPVPVTDVAYFYSEDRVIFLNTYQDKRYIIDFTLDELEKLLNPRQFFRLNRQFIASFKSIKQIHPFFNGKLRLHLFPDHPEGVVISKDKGPLFKQWLDQ